MERAGGAWHDSDFEETLTRVLSGIAEVDALTALVTKPPAVRALKGLPPEVSEITITKATRELELLASFPALRRVVARAITAAQLETLCGTTSIEQLEIGGSSIRGLQPIAALKGLRLLLVDGSSKLASIEGIENLKSLEYLVVGRSTRLTSLEPVRKLNGLRVLFLSGAMYTPMRIASLAPLAELSGLRSLTLSNVRVRDRSLRPLHSLRHLARLELPLFFPESEFAALARALPAADGQWRELYVLPRFRVK